MAKRDDHRNGKDVRQAPPLLGIHEAALYSADLPEAVRFWTSLGFSLIRHTEGEHAFFRAGSDVLLVFNPEFTRAQAGAVPAHGTDGAGHVAFDVPDATALEAWRARLTEAGVPVESEVEWPSGGKSLYFRDPAGNSIEFITRGVWAP